ncbi:MAG TPA: glycerophosphoryl diester phosphodiesterase membrane domain-containing protein, partial [Dongiaceae bacterium]
VLNKYFGFDLFPAPGEPVPQFDTMPFENLPWGWISVAMIAFTLASLVTSSIWLAATSFAAFQYLRGQAVEFLGSLQRGVSVALPCIGAMLLISLGFYALMGIAFIPFFSLLDDALAGAAGDFFQTFAQIFLMFTVVFIIAVTIIIRLIVTFPIIAVERPGVFAAFRRSWDLTRGNFWRIFGIGLVLVVALYAVSIPVSILTMILGLTLGANGIFIGQGVNIVISVAANAVFAIAAAVIYVELRRAKEGFGIEDIATVFD